ncbi:MAG: S4 domain-containing protein [Candidatus Micrarchaeota archaeon]|nr:S4 domain-containing protein [Candidatus Micrarchaeota archaeon]
MSKKGGSHHLVRICASKYAGVRQRKGYKWALVPMPGKHKKGESVAAGTFLRDVLGLASNLKEAKKIVNSGNLVVDGKKVKDVKFSIGLMDIVYLPAEKKYYRMSLSGRYLYPKEISAEESKQKYLKVVGKTTIKKGKIQIALHDGRTFLGDNNIKRGDTCVMSVPDFKLVSHLKLQPGVRCLITHGRHTGQTAKLEQIIQRPGSHETEAMLSGPSGQFITLLKYLFVIDDKF